MSLKKRALSGFFWSSLQLFGNRFIGFGVSLILARLLLPSEFGFIAMLGVFVGLSNALINSGLTQSLIRSENLDDEDFSTVFYFNLVGSVLKIVNSYIRAITLQCFFTSGEQC
jgi:O-antigen/teichoic acid export membrane protein